MNAITLPYPGAKLGEREFYWKTWSKHYSPEAARAQRIRERIAKLEASIARLKAEKEDQRKAA